MGSKNLKDLTFTPIVRRPMPDHVEFTVEVADQNRPIYRIGVQETSFFCLKWWVCAYQERLTPFKERSNVDVN